MEQKEGAWWIFLKRWCGTLMSSFPRKDTQTACLPVVLPVRGHLALLTGLTEAAALAARALNGDAIVVLVSAVAAGLVGRGGDRTFASGEFDAGGAASRSSGRATDVVDGVAAAVVLRVRML